MIPAAPAELDPRRAIVAGCRQLVQAGLTQGSSGNISLRRGPAMLITPSAVPYEGLSPDDIVAVGLETGMAAQAGGAAPSSEWLMHRDILRARPEIGAIVHAHPPHCTALASAGRGIPPFHYMIATFGGDDVQVAGYATFGSQDLSDRVVAALAGRSACLMANHGMVACGRDLAAAMARAIELEALARQYLLMLASAPPRLLTAREMQAARRRFESYRPD